MATTLSGDSPVVGNWPDLSASEKSNVTPRTTPTNSTAATTRAPPSIAKQLVTEGRWVTTPLWHQNCFAENRWEGTGSASGAPDHDRAAAGLGRVSGGGNLDPGRQ